MEYILVSDYDKTFYLNDSDIEINKDYLKKFKKEGNMFILATGRSYFDFKKVVTKYKINYDFAIINHGATILDKYDSVLYNSYIDNDIMNKLVIDLNLNGANNYFLCSNLESRVSPNHKDITKINVEYSDEKTAQEIDKYINNKYSDYINTYIIGPTKVEIVSKNSSKLQAIMFLENKNRYNKNNIYTIGDGNSDIEMINHYNGYCMKNSVDELKKVANKEYSSVSELIDDILNR